MSSSAWLRQVAALFSMPLLAIGVTLTNRPAHAETWTFHASASGKQTLDDTESGGNPFAGALIEILRQSQLMLPELAAALHRGTVTRSRGFQLPEVPYGAAVPNWRVLPPVPGERRIALVLVVSDYARSGGAPSLPGAMQDARRVAAAFTQAGFTTNLSLDLELAAMRRRLSDFSIQSKDHDAAVIYTTGHGVEVGGKIFLLPGDYPTQERNAALEQRALGLSEITTSAQARQVNLIFYAGCRDNPFGD